MGAHTPIGASWRGGTVAKNEAKPSHCMNMDYSGLIDGIDWILANDKPALFYSHIFIFDKTSTANWNFAF